jgi:hypothetical protein
MQFKSEEEYNRYFREVVLPKKKIEYSRKTRLKSRIRRGKNFHSVCSICGKPFSEESKKNIGLYKFCSEECRGKNEVKYGREIRSKLARIWMKKYPEKVKAEKLAQKVSLEEFCELCPEDDKRKAIMRHHPDYDYPEIFVSVCGACHRHVHNQNWILMCN